MQEKIDVTKVDLALLAQKAFELSQPQGLGFLHFNTGQKMSIEDAKSLVNDEGRIALSMDYIGGRACKMTIFREDDGSMWMSGSWYDHTDAQLKQLCDAIGIEIAIKEETEHGCACNCNDCRTKRGDGRKESDFMDMMGLK